MEKNKVKYTLFPWRSLKSRVTLLSLVIFLVSIWSLFLYAGGMLHKDLELLLGDQQSAMASIVAADINRQIEFRLTALEKVAEGIGPGILSDTNASQAFLEDRSILPRLFNGGFFMTQADGTATASVPLSAHRRGINYLDRDHISAALREGKPTVSKPVIGRVLRAPVFSVAVPIRDGAGSVIGALAGVVDLSKPNFLDEIAQGRYGKNGGFLLVAPQYRMIVTASDKGRVMEVLPAPGVNSPLDRFIQGYEGSQIFVNPKGVEVLASAKGVPASGWYVAINLPTEELFAPVHALLRRMLMAVIFFTTLAGGVTWWMLRRQLSPMLDAVKRLSDLSDSGLPVTPLPIARGDEVGLLIGAFNRLLETLSLREARLVESEENHRSILRTALNGIWQADATGGLIEFNEAFCRMSGYTPEELRTMNIADLEVMASGNDGLTCLQLIKDQGEARFETRQRRKDGTVMDLEVSAQYRSVGKGQCVAFVQDITQRKRMEQELRRSRDEWSRTFDSMRDLIFIIDGNHRILRINRTAVDALGITREQALATPCYVLMHGADSPPASCPQGETLLDYGEHWIKARLEPLGHHYQVTTTPIFDDNGNYQATVHVAHDITESRHYERDLELARDAAESANRAKSEFLANMSHEIRTPMNGIMGMAQLLEYTQPTDEQKEYLAAIRTSADSLLTLIDDILDLSRIESGKIELERRDFSLRSSINEVIKSQNPLIQGKGLSIGTDISPAVPDNLAGDQLRLKQVLLNLLGNAVKFTKKGGVTITVTVSERQDDIVLLKIGVMDSGIGINSEAMERIFAPFVQADGSTTRKYGGTGLGLAICTRLAEKMGGRVWAESNEGVGSIFFLQIPFTVNEAVPEQNAGWSGDEGPPAWDGPPLRILLADDQEINLVFAARILQRGGHAVSEVRNGREALEKWGEGAVDVILMDVQMPVMNGIEATQAIRERERSVGGHIPIIAVTARALHEERKHILSQGFDGYVTKPFEVDRLLGEVRRCLNNSGRKG